MRAAARGAGWSCWVGALLLAALEAFRPGFLALGNARGWAGAAAALAPFILVGALAGAWTRRRLPPRRAARKMLLALWLPVALLPLAGRILRSDPPPSELDPPWKVIVFGVDGATWEVIRPLIRSGRLPQFARLLDEGASGVLLSELPPLSPRLWTTIASGVGPDRHGALDFYSTQASINVQRIWDVVEERGGRIGLWGWLLTWPPGQRDGFVVPGWLARGPETWPPELGFYQLLKGDDPGDRSLGQLAGAAIRGYAHGLRLPTLLQAGSLALWIKLERPDERRAEPPTEFLQGAMATDIFVHLVRRTGPDFSAFVLYTTDAFAHKYWRDFEPAKFGLNQAPDGGRYREALPEAYRMADRTLGRLMEIADRRTVIAVVSDHGTTARGSSGGERYAILSEPLIRALGMEGRLSAFAVGRYLYLRQIDPDGGRRLATPAFVEELRQVTVQGERLFDVEPIDPPEFAVTVRGTPALAAGASFATGMVPLDELLTVSEFSGEHTLEGIIGLWGGPIAPRVALEGVTIRDVTPTLLALLGCPLSSEMSGRVLRSALRPEAVASLAIRTVPSYGPPQHRLAKEPLEDDVLTERLKALGYIE